MHEQADKSDYQQHHDGQMVHLQRKIHFERAGHDPIEIILEKRKLIRGQQGKFPNGFEHGKEGQRNGPNPNGIYSHLRPVLAEQAVDRGAGQRQRENNPEMIEYRHHNFRRFTRSMFSEWRFW